MIAKFQGLKAVVTLGPCEKIDVLELQRRTGFKLIDIDFQEDDPDPELLNMLADHVLTPEDEAQLKRMQDGSAGFINALVEEVWGNEAESDVS